MASPAYSMHDQTEWLMWLAEWHLIHISNDCKICQRSMALVHRGDNTTLGLVESIELGLGLVTSLWLGLRVRVKHSAKLSSAN